MASVEFISVFVKILWRLFQLHLLLFARAYALNIKSSFFSGASRLSSCPIMRTKTFLNQHADILSRSFRLSAVGGMGCHGRSPSHALPLSFAHLDSHHNLHSPRSMLLFMTGRESFLASQQAPDQQRLVDTVTLPAPFMDECEQPSDAFDPVDTTNYISETGTRTHASALTSTRLQMPTASLASVAQYFDANQKASESSKNAETLVAKNKNKSPAEMDILVIGLSHHNAGTLVLRLLSLISF
jgi:hypothetical protein